MEPTPQDISQFGLASSVSAIAKWVGLTGERLTSWTTLMGFDEEALDATHPRLLCGISQNMYEGILGGC